MLLIDNSHPSVSNLAVFFLSGHRSTGHLTAVREDMVSLMFASLLVCLQDYAITLSLSLRFNGHFPGEPGFAGVYCSKG